MEYTEIITCAVVPESARMAFVDKLMGLSYILLYEPAMFQFAEILSEDYSGGFWEFVSLSNGGFFAFPRGDTTFAVNADNGFEGTLSPEAFGLVATLYALSNLSFGMGAFAETCADQFHKARAFASQHTEASAILAAID